MRLFELALFGLLLWSPLFISAMKEAHEHGHQDPAPHAKGTLHGKSVGDDHTKGKDGLTEFKRDHDPQPTEEKPKKPVLSDWHCYYHSLRTFGP